MLVMRVLKVGFAILIGLFLVGCQSEGAGQDTQTSQSSNPEITIPEGTIGFSSRTEVAEVSIAAEQRGVKHAKNVIVQMVRDGRGRQFEKNEQVQVLKEENIGSSQYLRVIDEDNEMWWVMADEVESE